MQPAQLAAQCAESINACTTVGLSMDDAAVLVTTPKGWKAPPRFPRGEIVQWKEDGTRVRYLPAARLLAWLAAHFPDQVKIAAALAPGQQAPLEPE
jgi:hypothetical protein